MVSAAGLRRFAFAGERGSALLSGELVDGPVILLVHPANLQAACWSAVAERLSGRACVAIDLSGHGRSQRRASYSIDSWVEECATLIDELAVPAVHVVGASVGAAVAVGLAAAHPDVVMSLTTVGGAIRPASAGIDEVFRATIEADGPVATLADAVSAEPDMSPATAALAVDQLSTNSAADVLGIWHAAAGADVRGLLDAVGCPTLALVGELDSSCPPDESAEFARATGGRLAILQGCGHLPMYTAVDEVAAAIDAHVCSHDSRQQFS